MSTLLRKRDFQATLELLSTERSAFASGRGGAWNIALGLTARICIGETRSTHALSGIIHYSPYFTNQSRFLIPKADVQRGQAKRCGESDS